MVDPDLGLRRGPRFLLGLPAFLPSAIFSPKKRGEGPPGPLPKIHHCKLINTKK